MQTLYQNSPIYQCKAQRQKTKSVVKKIQSILLALCFLASLAFMQNVLAKPSSHFSESKNFEMVLDESIRLLNESATVTFFYSSYCPHCHQLAEKLLVLEERGLNLVGGCLGGTPFKNLKENPAALSLAKTHRLAGVPAIVVSTKTGSRLLVQGDTSFKHLVSHVIAAAVEVGEEHA